MKLPLEDGDRFVWQGHTRQVEGTIKAELQATYPEPVCWTRDGFWFRRRDGMQMTAGYHSGIVMTVSAGACEHRNIHHRVGDPLSEEMEERVALIRLFSGRGEDERELLMPTMRGETTRQQILASFKKNKKA